MAELLAPDRICDLRSAQLTYIDVGGTAGRLPPGYHHQLLSEPIGHGYAQFEAAARCLLTWEMHARAELHPQVSELVVQKGSVGVLRLQLGPISLSLPVRVVRLVDELYRQGFAYGTLPGHPARGEESFVVELAEDGTVFFHRVAFSRPGRWFTTLGRPVARASQLLVSERYLAAVRNAAHAVSDHEAR